MTTPDPFSPTLGPSSRIFTAAYDGDCAHCLGAVEEGDDVCYEDNELIHARCALAARGGLPAHRTEAGYPRCSTCDGGGCPDCTDPA